MVLISYVITVVSCSCNDGILMEPAVYGCDDNKINSNTVMFRLKTLTILGSKAE